MASPQLFDQYGNLVEKPKLLVEESAPSLTGVRSILSAHPSIGLTPQRLAGILLEAEDADATRYLELAEDMEEKDLHYAGVLSSRKLSVSQLELSIAPASDRPEDTRAADMVRELLLQRDELQEELFDMLDAIGKGFSATEILWDTSGPQWAPQCLEWREPKWFMFDRNDGRTLLRRDGAMLVPLTPYKYIVHTPKIKSGLPIRGGLARAAAWIYLFKNYALKDWVTFAEIFGQPYRIGTYGPSATKDDKSALLRAVSSIGSDAAAIIPEGMKIEFLECARSGSIDLYEKLCRFMDEQLSKHVLGQTTTTEVTQGGGSRALGEVHDRTKRDIQRADARQLANTLNRCLVRPLVDLNMPGPHAAYPKLVIGLPDELSTLQKVAALAVLVPMGMKVGITQMRSSLGFAKPADDEELFTTPAAGAESVKTAPLIEAPNAAGRASLTRLRRAANAGDAGVAGDPGADGTLKPDVVDQLTRDALDDDGWQRAMTPVVDPIREFFDGVGSLPEARARLAELVDDMSLDRLSELLGNAEFAAHLAGAVGVDPEATL